MRDTTFYRICIVLPLLGLGLGWLLGAADFLIATAGATYGLTALVLLVVSVRVREPTFVSWCNWSPLILALCFLLPSLVIGTVNAITAASGKGGSEFGFMLVVGVTGAFYSALVGTACLLIVKLLRWGLKAAGAIRIEPM